MVGFATIADTVPTEKLGTTFGIITPFMNAGAFAGPMVSGILLQTVGYWATWSTAIAVVSCPGLQKIRKLWPDIDVAGRGHRLAFPYGRKPTEGKD